MGALTCWTNLRLSGLPEMRQDVLHVRARTDRNGFPMSDKVND
jgi:hypothetical protein